MHIVCAYLNFYTKIQKEIKLTQGFQHLYIGVQCAIKYLYRY